MPATDWKFILSVSLLATTVLCGFLIIMSQLPQWGRDIAATFLLIFGALTALHWFGTSTNEKG